MADDRRKAADQGARDGAGDGAKASEGLAGALLSGLPFAEALGVRVITAKDGEALLSAPYDPRFIGDPETGVIHGGVVTALLDTCAGVAVVAAGATPVNAATLDLRIDYMRAATPGRAIFARATVFRETRTISFVRAAAFHENEEASSIANAVGAFMIADRSGPPKSGAA